MSLKRVIDTIRKYDKFLITAHVNPEADALGSQLALYELIKRLGKKAICVDNDKTPPHYKFLPGIENIKQTLKKREDFQVAVVLDCPTISRTGKVKNLLKKAKIIVNIDHHISNGKFGDVNWVDSSASSAGEMIYTLYKKMGIEISKKVALYIYIAILTDTGSFNYGNTSSVTHEIVSDLLGYGLQPQDISSFIYENKKISDVKLLGKVISTLKTDKTSKIAYMVCTKDMLKKTGSAASATENFINFAKSIEGIDIAIFIKEDLKSPGEFNISLRSKGDIDVNKMASFFDGGGHKNAAGCVIRGTLTEVKRKVLAKAKEAL